MYHDYVTISLVNKLKKTFNLLSSLCVLIVDLKVSSTYASVQMIGSLSTNEEKENKESGMARWRQNEYLAYCLESFFCF